MKCVLAGGQMKRRVAPPNPPTYHLDASDWQVVAFCHGCGRSPEDSGRWRSHPALWCWIALCTVSLQGRECISSHAKLQLPHRSTHNVTWHQDTHTHSHSEPPSCGYYTQPQTAFTTFIAILSKQSRDSPEDLHGWYKGSLQRRVSDIRGLKATERGRLCFPHGAQEY